jgi:hypothetical protein
VGIKPRLEVKGAGIADSDSKCDRLKKLQAIKLLLHLVSAIEGEMHQFADVDALFCAMA